MARGFFITEDFKVEGGILRVAQKATSAGAKANPMAAKLVRLE
jgi:hypothetical protein